MSPDANRKALPAESKTAELDARLLELRVRLRQARDERGGCPTWDEVRADLVPGGSRRPGREERQAHVADCPYCGEHVREWRASLDYASDRLEAVERGVARGITQGAIGLLRTIGHALPGGAPNPRRADRPRRAAKQEPARPPRALSAREQRQDSASIQVSRLLVVEMADGRGPPTAIFMCAQILEAEVAQVESIDELAGDPDLALVCGVILGGPRPPASWPDAVRHARSLVPKRPVVLLATFGSESTPGARRALGAALCSEADPAERILLALDPDLR